MRSLVAQVAHVQAIVVEHRVVGVGEISELARAHMRYFLAFFDFLRRNDNRLDAEVHCDSHDCEEKHRLNDYDGYD